MALSVIAAFCAAFFLQLQLGGQLFGFLLDFFKEAGDVEAVGHGVADLHCERKLCLSVRVFGFSERDDGRQILQKRFREIRRR